MKKNCDFKQILQEFMPNQKVLADIASFFDVFSDITRIKMIIALSLREMCVTDLTDILKLHQSTVSHQLKLLRDANIVSYKRAGKQLYYYISNRHVEELMLTCAQNLE